MDTFFIFAKLIIALIVVLLLMLLSLKLAGKSYGNINSNKYIKVIDKVQIGKESFVTVLKVGDKGYLLSSTNNNTEVIEKLDKEEILKIEEEKRKTAENISGIYDKMLVNFKDGSKRIIGNIKAKEEKDEQ